VFIEAAELHLVLFHPSDCVARYEKQVTESEQEDSLEHEEGHCRPFGPYLYVVFRSVEYHHIESQGYARLQLKLVHESAVEVPLHFLLQGSRVAKLSAKIRSELAAFGRRVFL